MQSIRILAVLLLAALTGCAWEVTDMGPHHKIVPGDKRILDPSQFGLIGQVVQIDAEPPGAGSLGIAKEGNTILVKPISFDEAGSSKIQRFLSAGLKLNAQNQYSPSIITAALESTVTRLGDSLNESYPQDSILQAVIRFGTGEANQGTQSAASLAFANIELDPRIIIDIAQGTMISLPASYFQLDFLYTSVTTSTLGFAQGVNAGPSYQVDYSLGYEPQVHNGAVTMTQLHPARDLASGGGGTTYFFRPKYSTGVWFQWFTWTTGTANVLDVTFYNALGIGIWHVSNYPITDPPSILPWPAGAVAVAVSQSSGAPYGYFRCVSVLEF